MANTPYSKWATQVAGAPDGPCGELKGVEHFLLENHMTLKLQCQPGALVEDRLRAAADAMASLREKALVTHDVKVKLKGNTLKVTFGVIPDKSL